MTTTMTVIDCNRCSLYKRQVARDEAAVVQLVRTLCRGQETGRAPHQLRGVSTRLSQAKMKLAESRINLEDHQYGQECGA